MNCFAGGLRIETGLDLNGNETLDADEVTNTSYVCHGYEKLFKATQAEATKTVSVAMSTAMNVAWDGTNFWFVSGGSSSGTRLQRRDADLALVSSFSPGLDFRSIFGATDGSSTLYARAYSSNVIHQMTAPGVFAPHVTLTGGSLNSQASVIWDDVNEHYAARSEHVVYRWNAAGEFVDSVTLTGQSGTNLATVRGYYLTYSNTKLTAWRATDGVKADETTLVDAMGNASFGLSFANGLVWVSDYGGNWRAYDVVR